MSVLELAPTYPCQRLLLQRIVSFSLHTSNAHLFPEYLDRIGSLDIVGIRADQLAA